MGNCWLCGGAGGWDDSHAMQSVVCHICRPIEAEIKASKRPVRGWMDSIWPKMPARYCDGPQFQVEPFLLVIHSASISDNVAEFFRDTGRVRYGDRWVKVNAHINWSREHDTYAQSVRLDTVGKHAGGSVYAGRTKINFCSIGIELPNKGPPLEHIRVQTINTIKQLKLLMPSLRVAVRHCDIDPRKRDPLRFDWMWLDGLGLQLPYAIRSS
jgi:hypothetical protein